MTASTIHDFIGERFERIFHQQFPDFVKQGDNSASPDFFNGDIWIEAKLLHVEGEILKGTY